MYYQVQVVEGDGSDMRCVIKTACKSLAAATQRMHELNTVEHIPSKRLGIFISNKPRSKDGRWHLIPRILC